MLSSLHGWLPPLCPLWKASRSAHVPLCRFPLLHEPHLGLGADSSGLGFSLCVWHICEIPVLAGIVPSCLPVLAWKFRITGASPPDPGSKQSGLALTPRPMASCHTSLLVPGAVRLCFLLSRQVWLRPGSSFWSRSGCPVQPQASRGTPHSVPGPLLGSGAHTPDLWPPHASPCPLLPRGGEPYVLLTFK